MADTIVILDVIIQQTSPDRNTQLCSNLNDAYYSANAAANQPYTFGWGPDGGMSGNLKFNVGSVSFLGTYNGSTQKIEIVGTCGSAALGNFAVQNQKTLVYTNSGFSFTTEFHLVDGVTIEITVRPGANTTISADAPSSFA